MKSPVLSKRTIKQLRRDLQARKFAVPKLQRNFVWDGRRAAMLLDSIYRNMPIGSLFLWEMDRRSAHLIRQSTKVLPYFDDTNKHIWFVIDGQQRLSVIFQAFEGQVLENDAGRVIDFGRLCFVVRPSHSQEDAPRIVYRKPQGTEFVPLKNILAADWKPRLPSNAKWFLKRIRECRERLLNYPIPVVTVLRASLEEIGEIFVRVNSQGMRITSADRAIALMGQLDVRAMAEETRQRVRGEVFALRAIDPILMGFNLIVEKSSPDSAPPKLEMMARHWSKKIELDAAQKRRFTKIWHRYQAAFLTGVDYIHRRFPVHDESYLPSANMLATLAVFFYNHRGQPNRAQATEIQKWFWATGVAQRYSGRGYHRNIVADAKLFQALAHGARRRFLFRDYLDPAVDIQAAEYLSSSARTRTYFCLLAKQKPLYLDNGQPIPLDGAVVSHANRRNRHHIFPQARMRDHFPPRVFNGLCNICFLVSLDNQGIGARLPRSYLADYRDAGRAQFNRVMKSHLIPVSEGSGVWDLGVVNAFKKFRRERLRLICNELEREAGIRLFSRKL